MSWVHLVELVNLFCHATIFAGAFYVVLHNRNLPHWHVTPLWYAGLSCLLTGITIILGFALGDSFALSYHNIGVVGETLLNISLSVIAITFLLYTARKEKISRKG
jgi:serine acetyltransferase